MSPLLALAERRLPALTRLRAREPLPIALDRKRIYILPTAFGFGFAAILLVMLVGALNYANNAALLLTCLLGAVAINSMLETFRGLDRLAMTAIHAGTAEAGSPIDVDVGFVGNGRRHPALRLDGCGEQAHFSVDADTETRLRVSLATTRRGWIDVPRLRVATTWPFGWFRAWSWLAPAARVLVYPRAERGGPPPPRRIDDAAARRREPGDEWSSLREYRAGDPLRRVAWRASARGDALLVKTFEQAAAERSQRLEWDATQGLDHEDRIARLARWVVEAHRGGSPWSLVLPDGELPMARGEAHFHRCLRALAELP